MAKVFALSLGFDWNAIPINPSLGADEVALYPLQYGLMDLQDSSPAWLTNLPDASTPVFLFFDVFDITPLNAKSSPVSVGSISFEMSFTDIHSIEPAKPLDPQPSANDYTFATSDPVSVSPLPSQVFGGMRLNNYPIGVGTNNPASHPNGQQFQANTNGTFALTFRIVVTQTDGQFKNYILDPEMIVGPSNGGDTTLAVAAATPQPAAVQA